MNRFWNSLPATVRLLLRDDERGTTAIEYAIMASGIALAIISTVFSLGTSVTNLYDKIVAMF
jgi:pilus assembly protein Flp/PilA